MMIPRIRQQHRELNKLQPHKQIDSYYIDAKCSVIQVSGQKSYETFYPPTRSALGVPAQFLFYFKHKESSVLHKARLYA